MAALGEVVLMKYVQLPKYPGYRVGRDGSLWTKKRSRLGKNCKWKRMRCHTNKATGYLYFKLRLGKPSRQHNICQHTLLLEAFVGPCPKGMECRHLDGNRKNNILSNLQWGTRKEQCLDKVRHGTAVRGRCCHFAKLNEEAVLAMRRMMEQGATLKEAANKFGCDESYAWKIRERKRWGWLA